MASHRSLKRDILRCRRCPRLVSALVDYRAAHPESFSAPVPARGAATARRLIVGLAPGRLGANQTGKVFVGDFSGRFLHEALFRAQLCSSPDPFAARLQGVRMTNVVKCWPPGNAPAATEVAACRDHLERELALFWNPAVRQPRAILCLGRLAHEALQRLLLTQLPAGVAVPAFAHGASAWLAPTLKWISSYHPSLQNVNTGRLTAPMLDEVIGQLGHFDS